MSSKAVKSTTLRLVTYDAERQLLRLEFQDHSIYEYSGVPAGVHDALLQAQSKGGYFNRTIRNHFPSARVTADCLS